LDPKIGGSESRRLVSFIRGGNIWIASILSGEEWQLTYTFSNSIGCGISEFVAQEEFHRFTGYWWSPDGSNRIMYLEVDESEVETVLIPQPGDSVKVEEFRYPRAGSYQ